MAFFRPALLTEHGIRLVKVNDELLSFDNLVPPYIVPGPQVFGADCMKFGNIPESVATLYDIGDCFCSSGLHLPGRRGGNAF